MDEAAVNEKEQPPSKGLLVDNVKVIKRAHRLSLLCVAAPKRF
jgi:hypothetical protein